MSFLQNRVFEEGRRVGEASVCSWVSKVPGLFPSGFFVVVVIVVFHFYLGCNVYVKSFYFGISKETKSGPNLLSRRCCVPLRMPL